MNNNIIEVDIKSKEGIFNSFNENQISDELGNYIFVNAKKSSTKAELVINIDNKIPFTEEEKEKLVDGIREYFGLLVRSKLNYKKFNSIKKMILFMIGMLLILLSEVLSDVVRLLIPEVISIAGCVAIWESVTILLFIDSKNNYEIKKLKELSECDINFTNN